MPPRQCSQSSAVSSPSKTSSSSAWAAASVAGASSAVCAVRTMPGTLLLGTVVAEAVREQGERHVGLLAHLVREAVAGAFDDAAAGEVDERAVGADHRVGRDARRDVTAQELREAARV